MLHHCYVSPGTESDFDRTIDKLLKNSSISLSKEEENVIGGDTDKFIREIETRERTVNMRYPVVVVGHVGAGKTTFLHKSLSHFRGTRAAFCAFLNQEGMGQAGTIDWRAEEQDLARRIIEKLSTAAGTILHAEKFSEGDVRQADPYDPETLHTLLREELDKKKRLGEKLWQADPVAWERKKFEIMEAYSAKHVELLIHYINHLRARFKRKDNLRFPVLIVIDNVDQASNEYQKCVYGFAQRLTLNSPAVVILSIRDDTFRAGRRPEGFLSSSPLQFVYEVDAPPLDKVLRLRARFAAHALDKGSLPKTLTHQRDEFASVCESLRRMSAPDGLDAAELLAGLSGNNTRNALGLVRESIFGSVLIGRTSVTSAEDVLETLFAALGPDFVKSRLGLGNCFDAHPSTPPCHALPVRLLAYYAWTMGAPEQPISEMTEVVTARFSSWGYQPVLVETVLRSLIAAGLVRSSSDYKYEPRPELPPRLSLTAAGLIHVERLVRLRPYRALMACLARWYDRELADNFIKEAHASGGTTGATLGDIIASPAPQLFDAYLRLAVSREDAHLALSLRKQTWVREVLSRSTSLPTDALAEIVRVQQEESRTAQEAASSSKQLELFAPTVEAKVGRKSLRRFHGRVKFRDSVMIPRILWALEWGRRNESARLTAADIARVLKDFGDLDVPGTNVARTFRELDSSVVEGLWQVDGRRYEITPAGTDVLIALLEQDANE